MTVAPAGPISIPKHRLRTMVARLDAFREAVGAETAEAAAERIYLNAAVLDGDVVRPYGVISLPDDGNEFDIVAGGAQHDLRPAGSLWLYLTADADLERPWGNDSATRFENWLGAIWQGLRHNAARDDDLPITRLGWGMRPKITMPGTGHQRQFWIAILDIAWGAK